MRFRRRAEVLHPVIESAIAGFPALKAAMKPIKRILCPVDLSDVSRYAIDHAALLAGWYSAKVTALYVWNPIVIPSADFTVVGTGPLSVPTEREMQEVRAGVMNAVGPIASDAVDVLVQNGHPADRILELGGLLPADLIVIGTHGAGGFEHLLLGSVTEKVLRKAMCPVMTIPPRARATSKLPFQRILCPIDFSDSSAAALDFAFSLAKEGKAELTILHVFDWVTRDDPLANQPITREYHQELEVDLTRTLHAVVPDSVRKWCHPRTRTAHGKAYREILRVADEESADLIVIGVHGRNALDLMLFGSTTNQVVRRATCPVLTLRR